MGPGPRVRGWSAAFGKNGEARRLAPHAAVRLLRTRRPTPKEYDLWARAPVPGAGPLLLVEMRRRGSSLLVWWFAFFAHGDRRPRSMTRGPGPQCQRLGLLDAHRARSTAVSWGVNGTVLLKKGFPPSAAVTLFTRCSLSPSSSPRSSAAVAAMALLDPPECFQSEVALNLVRNLLGWGAPTFAGRIRVDASPLGDLAAREFVLFVSNLPCGLALPISSFFVLLLEELGLQPQHFTPHFIL
jgi:hypothetical protein